MNGFSFGFPVESEIEVFRDFDFDLGNRDDDGVWLQVFTIHGVIVLLNLYFYVFFYRYIFMFNI